VHPFGKIELAFKNSISWKDPACKAWQAGAGVPKRDIVFFGSMYRQQNKR